MKKCTNCVWEGEDIVGPLQHCPVCGDNTEDCAVVIKPVSEKGKKKVDMDLNNDGKVDAEDVSMAAKVMRNVRGSKKRKR